MATNANYTLEEILALTNDELTSNWSRLASLIKSYEGIPWDEARPKAIDLIRFGKATDYIQQVRDLVSGKIVVEKNEPVKEEPPSKKKKPTRPKKTNSLIPKVTDVHQSNYLKLLRVVPDLEDRILSGNEVYGKSKRTGYMDFNLEMIHQDKTGYYLALSHYYVENGDMIADPDMVVLVNLKNQTLIPLSFQDRLRYKTTFEDIYDRKLINVKELKAQSSFLGFWLGNLKKQGHKISWKEPDTTGELPKGEPQKPPKQEAPEIVEIPIVETAPNEEQSAEIEEILKHWKRFASFIRTHEGITQEQAEEKALKLKEENKAWDYVKQLLSKKDQSTRNVLFHANYNALIALIPDILKQYRDEDLHGFLYNPNRQDLLPYDVYWSKPISNHINSIAIFESAKEGKQEIGFVVLAIHRSQKRLWVVQAEGNFFKIPSYDVSDWKEKELAEEDQKELIKVNERFGRFLNLLIDKGYKNKWLHIQTEQQKEREEREKVNKEIPDFNVGEVELTDAHIRAGLTQKHIDWINKHKQGMVITPRRNMTNNTKDFFMDQAVQAKKPGFRISKTGKLYYEGRSNRSDLTDGGL